MDRPKFKNRNKIQLVLSAFIGIFLSIGILVLLSILYAFFVFFMMQSSDGIILNEKGVRETYLTVLPLVSYASFWLTFYLGLIPAMILGIIVGITVVHPSRVKKQQKKNNL